MYDPNSELSHSDVVLQYFYLELTPSKLPRLFYVLPLLSQYRSRYLLHQQGKINIISRIKCFIRPHSIGNVRMKGERGVADKDEPHHGRGFKMDMFGCHLRCLANR